MTKWRPRQRLRVIAIGLHWRGEALLAAEVPRDDGSIKGLRPLGGGVEFGETWAEALAREFDEELSVRIKITGPPLVLENIYEHEGVRGHEIVFAAPIEFEGQAFAHQDEIEGVEDNGARFRARWHRLDDLDSQGLALYPTGLKHALLGR